MTMIEFDPFDFKVAENPYAVYRALRDERPVYFNPERELWALARYEDVQATARDWKTFSNEPGVELDEMIDAFGKGDFLNMDPPRHDELRGLVGHHFAPERIARLEPIVRRMTCDLLDRVVNGPDVDLASEFAWPLPIAVISHLLGIPEEDGPILMEWLHALGERTPGEEHLPMEVGEASDRIKTYLVSLVDERGRNPRQDLLTEIVRARDTQMIEPDEIAGLAFILILAGTDTTASLISNSLMVLAQHPEQRELLARREVETAAAVEELLRFESPVQMLARTATVDTEIGGRAIPAKARVLLLWGSANRDERVFEHGDALDLRRAPKRHLAFGDGIHFCLGAPLARLEGRVAFNEFFQRIESYEITGQPEWIRSPTNRGLTSLPTRVTIR